MNRLSNLTETNLTERVTRIVKDLEELRTTAQRFSSDSVLLYKGFSANAYDLQITSVAFNNKVVDITFAPTDNTNQALGGAFQLTINVFVSTGYTVDLYLEGLAPDGGVAKWRLYLSGSDASPVPVCQLKFYISTNAPGALTASVV